MYYFAVQLGMCLTEMGPLYDCPNESVILTGKNAAPAPISMRIAAPTQLRRTSRKPLAAAFVRRDHEPAVKLE
jgi:hypothetical protein